MNAGLAEQAIRDALRQDPSFTYEQVVAQIEAKIALVFESDKAIEVVQVREYGDGKLELYAFLGGGDFRSLRDDIRPKVEQFAREQGCSWIEMRTRPIAAKILAPWGYAITGWVDDKTAIIRKAI